MTASTTAGSVRDVPVWIRVRDILLLAMGFYVFAQLALMLAIPPGVTTPLWVPTGLTLAAVLLRGNLVVIGAFLGAFATNLSIVAGSEHMQINAGSFALAAGVGVSCALQALFSAWLVRRFSGDPHWRLWRIRQLLAVVVLGGMVGCTVSATLGNGAMYLAGISSLEQMLRGWFIWWMRDFTSVLLFGPVFLLLLQPGRQVALKRKLQVSVPVLLLVSLQIYAQLDAERRATDRLRDHLEVQSAELVRNIQNRVEHYHGTVGSLRAFFMASEKVLFEEFKQFAQAAREGVLNVETLHWIPLVTAAERESWEAQASRQLGREIHISEWESGELRRAAARDRYFPAYYLYPPQGHEAAFGFDVASHAKLSEAIARAMDSEGYVASRSIESMQNAGEFGAIMILRQVPGANPGLVAALVRTEMLFSGFLRNLEVSRLTMVVRDAVSSEEVFSWPREQQAAQWARIEPMRYSESVEVGERAWQVQTELDPQFVETTLFQRLWPFLTSGYLVVGLLAVIVVYATGTADATEREVLERTRELANERQFLDQIFNQLPLIAYVKEARTLRYVRINKLFTERTGLSAEAIIGRRDVDVFPPDVAQMFVNTDHEAQAERGKVVVLERELDEPGGRRWYRNYKMAITGVDGEVRLILGLTDDITERREQAQVFNTLVENMPTACLVVDSGGLIRYFNPVAKEMFELREPNVALENLIPEPIREMHQKLFDSFFANPERRPMGLGRELQARTLSGNIFPAEISLAPLQWRGQPSVLVMVYNVTERRAVLNALRRSEERLRFLLEHLGQGVIGLDRDGRAIFVNPAAERVLGFQASELIGHAVHPLIHHSHADGSPYPESECPSLRAVRPDQAVRVDDEVFWRKDGTSFPVEYVSSAVRDSGGEISGTVIVFDDITARKQLENSLLRSNEELDSFAYIASHDLKEPLRGISNYASFLKEDYDDKLDEEGRDMLDSLVRLTRRMENLISDLLQFSRLGRTELAEDDVDLRTLVEDVVDSLTPRLRELGVECRVETSLPALHCDRVRVAELYRNLISNAMKYNDKDDKWIVVGAEERDGKQVLYVKDNGIGIPEQHREKVFKIFKRLHTQEEFGGGTGVGLSIVKKIVDRHGGEIWVESTPGEGTAFYFTLS